MAPKEHKKKISKKKKHEKSKKSKHRKHNKSPSSSSEEESLSTSSSNRSSTKSVVDAEIKLLSKLKEKRLKDIDEKQKRKELIKATESAEEKRIRRLWKKEMKERRRKELMGWDNDYIHYTNSDNPFGDSHLLSTFVWNKKLAKEGMVGVSRDELEAQNRMKMEENRRELEKVKKYRLERELSRQQRDEEVSRLQRAKEAAQFQEWEKQEDEFHLQQARLRSQIRIEDGRAKPIDLLARYIDAENEQEAIEVHEPYLYFAHLPLWDLEDLVVDINVYKELEKGKNENYWNDVILIVEDKLQKLRKKEMVSKNEVIASRDAINESVIGDIIGVFYNKTISELEDLQKQIKSKISAARNNNKEEYIDADYWESVLIQLNAFMARVRLRNRHQENLKRKLEFLKEQQKVNEETTTVPVEEEQEPNEYEKELADNAKNAANEILSEEFDAYEMENCSPKYIMDSNDLELGTIVISEEDDMKRLEFARMQVLGTGNRFENVMTAEENALQKEARKGMTDDEVQFSVESKLDNQIYLWSDKYRPRKPRYFNRVHTGFEWNKYNQTHYDMDNPPPKIVQGYKFNIFYPDLIDKSSTPEYFLTQCPDNSEFAILRFHAGPPYEDIGFKIVHREWEYSYKKGFRCQFHNNIFQLWFHFKRYRYRR